MYEALKTAASAHGCHVLVSPLETTFTTPSVRNLFITPMRASRKADSVNFYMNFRYRNYARTRHEKATKMYDKALLDCFENDRAINDENKVITMNAVTPWCKNTVAARIRRAMKSFLSASLITPGSC
jgi:hypothetical protein